MPNFQHFITFSLSCRYVHLSLRPLDNTKSGNCLPYVTSSVITLEEKCALKAGQPLTDVCLQAVSAIIQRVLAYLTATFWAFFQEYKCFKAFSFNRLCLPDSLTKDSAPGPHWGSATDPLLQACTACFVCRLLFFVPPWKISNGCLIGMLKPLIFRNR